MKSFVNTIYFNREKEDNWDIVDKAEDLGFTCDTRDFLYTGYDIRIDVEIREDGKVKALEIQGVDVRDKEIYI